MEEGTNFSYESNATFALYKVSSEVFHTQSENSIVFVDDIEIKITNMTTLTMTPSIGVATNAREKNAYIKWTLSASVLMIEPIATSV